MFTRLAFFRARGSASVLFSVTLAVWLSANHVHADQERAGTSLAVDLQLSPLHGGLGLLIGLAGSWQARSGWRVGGALYDLLNGPPITDTQASSAGAPASAKLHFLGAALGKHIAIAAFGVTAELLLGAGDVSAYRDSKNEDFDRSWFWVAQPSIGIDFPELGPVRFRLGSGYRFVAALATGGTDIGPIAGALVQLTTTFRL